MTPSETTSKLIGVFTSKHSSWYFGVFLALVASFVGALGDNAVRLSYITEEKKQRKNMRPLYRRPLWLIGEILTVICNPALTIFALKFSAASIVVPFGGLHIFWNVVLCGYLLHERLSRVEITGSVIILFGIILVVSFGSHAALEYPIDRLVILFKQPVFIFYAVAAFFSTAIFLYFGELGIMESLLDLFKFRSDRAPFDSSRELARFCITALCGFCGGNGNLLAKSVIEAIHAEGSAVWKRYEFYLMGMGTTLLCALQALSLTVSLGRYEAKFVVPMVNSWLVASGSLGGMLLFQEYDDLSMADTIMFSVGVSSVIFGILVLIRGGKNAVQEEKLASEDERINLIPADIPFPKTSKRSISGGVEMGVTEASGGKESRGGPIILT